MGRIDEIKEELNYLKVWIGIMVVTTIGLIGWLLNHYETSSPVKIYSDVVFIAILTMVIFAIDRKIKKKIRKLREL